MLWMMIGLPRRANGVALKLKEPSKCFQAEMSGAMLDWQSKFGVSLASGRSLSQRKLGNVLETPAMMDRKSSLKVWIICSDVLRR